MTDLSVNVHHLTRVEGHGNIVVDARSGEVVDARFEIVESPRFFEAMLKGRHWQETQLITSRICGICAVGHTSTSVQATENALGIKISRQAHLLRKTILFAEQMQSHLLHVYFLAAPDFLAAPSVIPLAAKAPEVVKRALKLKKLANYICEVIAGRHVHPIAIVPGGFAKWPTAKELEALRDHVLSHSEDIDETVKLFSTFQTPEYERETEFVSLENPEEYAFYEGDIYSSDTGKAIPQARYASLIKERVVEWCTAKHAWANRDSYIVGALARFNNNHDQLHPRAKDAAETLGLRAPCYNTYMFNQAQVVEVVHCFEEVIAYLESLIELGVDVNEEPAEPRKMSGRGVGACEVPRGLLVHDYTYEDGLIKDANLVIPTNQNLANMDADLRALAPLLIDRPHEEAELAMEMLIRAYDPCISCSCHLLHVEFI